ncbi:MAG: hypothetical protein U1F10_03460 [Burkholderiales bacterium]
MPLRFALALAAALVALPFAAPAAAQNAQKPFDPGSRYICPNHADTGLDCYLDAVVHLYTMCRHVKSIEIIEFGLPAAQEGVNGAKSEYCVDKQKINIVRPYQAALREATPWHEVVEHLRELQQYWADSMAKLTWQAGEAKDAYDDRVLKVYDELSHRIDAVRTGFATAPDAGAKVAAEPKAAAKQAKAAAKAPAAAKPN